jgi:hypothetical protein
VSGAVRKSWLSTGITVFVISMAADHRPGGFRRASPNLTGLTLAETKAMKNAESYTQNRTLHFRKDRLSQLHGEVNRQHAILVLEQ